MDSDTDKDSYIDIHTDRGIYEKNVDTDAGANIDAKQTETWR